VSEYENNSLHFEDSLSRRFGTAGSFKKHGLIIFICLVLTFSFTAKSFSDTEAGQVLTVKRNVYMIRDARRDNAKPQMKLLLKDAVETGKKSRTKLFFTDDSILNLGELSRVEVEKYLYNPEKKRSKSIYRLIDGFLKVIVSRSDLEIHTPTAIAATRGTSFAIWIEGSGENLFTGIAVFDGEVILNSFIDGIIGQKGVVVGKNEMTRVYTQKSPEAVAPVAPEVIKEFTESTVVVGDTVEEDSELPETEPTEDTTTETSEPITEEDEDIEDIIEEDVIIEEPPVEQEPEEAFSPVSIEIIFP
jgi:hypothetical protein